MSIFVDKVIEAGGSMVPLAICSVISIAVIIERAVHLKRKNVIDDGLVKDISRHIQNGDYTAARGSGQQSSTIFGTIVDKGIEVHQIEGSDLDTALTETSSRELPQLEKFLNVLALIGSIAPLLGLFGTVYGMIMSFDEIAKESVDKELMAKGISVALITTGTGLLIAIPAIIANNYFRGRVDYFYRETEEGILAIMRAFHIAQQAAAEGPEAAPEEVAATQADTEQPADQPADDGEDRT